MASRGGFSSKFGFIAAAAGSAIGLGNIWQFPYVTGQNGGAAFLLLYIGWILFLGLPIMIGEIAIGRKTRSNPYGAYKALGGKSWALVGLFGIICGIMILSFYNVVSGWAFGYFVNVAFGDLLQKHDYSGFFDYFVHDFTDNLIFSLGFMLITAFIVYQGVQKGIEGAAKLLMPTLFVLLVSLVIYGLTLPNAMDGVRFYLLPDFSLINGASIYSALGQAFFSLSLGMGALITYGSYVGKDDNIISSAGLVSITDTLVSFLAGMMIFPLVFSTGQSPSEGPGLVFVALPAVFESMGPVLGKFIGSSFFLLLCFAALTSTISLLEVPVSYLVDEKKLSRGKAVIIMAAVVFLIGVPSMLGFGAVDLFTSFVHYEGASKSVMDVVQDVFYVIGLPLGGLLMSIFIARKWKIENMSEEVSKGYPGYIGSSLETFITVMISYICPLVLGIMFILTILQKFFGINFI
ncbi:MAG TPA: sodium-dependent transporter [Cyclobacteriaceae bacterium]|nr:sodium-dependent transporter [Cyclobacteriaceae bacterium]